MTNIVVVKKIPVNIPETLENIDTKEQRTHNISLPKMPPDSSLLILKCLQGGTSASPDR